MAKVIISCAVTGSAHTPTMSDALPISVSTRGQTSMVPLRQKSRSLRGSFALWPCAMLRSIILQAWVALRHPLRGLTSAFPAIDHHRGPLPFASFSLGLVQCAPPRLKPLLVRPGLVCAGYSTLCSQPDRLLGPLLPECGCIGSPHLPANFIRRSCNPPTSPSHPRPFANTKQPTLTSIVCLPVSRSSL